MIGYYCGRSGTVTAVRSCIINGHEYHVIFDEAAPYPAAWLRQDHLAAGRRPNGAPGPAGWSVIEGGDDG